MWLPVDGDGMASGEGTTTGDWRGSSFGCPSPMVVAPGGCESTPTAGVVAGKEILVCCGG